MNPFKKFSRNFLRYVYTYHFPDDEDEMVKTIEEFDLDEFKTNVNYGPIHLINRTKKPKEFRVGTFNKYNFSEQEYDELPILSYKEVYFAYPLVKEIYEKVFNKKPFEARIDELEKEYYLEFKLDDIYSVVLQEMYFLREEEDWMEYNTEVNLFDVLQSSTLASDMIL